jgi:hypothetical protein
MTSSSQRKKALKSLARDLRTETTPTIILERLKALNSALDDPHTPDKDALVFLRAGGLPSLICHLTGTATSDALPNPCGTLCGRTALAGEAVTKLLLSSAVMAELSSATDVVQSLIDVLRNTPSLLARTLAAHALLLIANGQPAHRGPMAQAGIVSLVLDLYVAFNAQELLPTGLMEAPLDLAQVLVCSETSAVEDLGRGIRASDTIPCFGALLILRVSILVLH